MTRFNAKRSGYYRENVKGKLAAYQSFVPWPLPPEPPLEVDHALLARLRSAHRSLGKLEQWAPALPCAHSFISMYVRKEAVISSQIEGTQATLEDVLDPEVDENSNLDLAEVISYIAALYHALFRIQADFPLCKRLLREIHEVLMQGSRGQEKNPGEFRRSQNWIGSSNSNLSTASYIPPNPEDMELALDALEAYLKLLREGTEI